MAAQTQPSTVSPMAHLNSCFDPDIDSFLNLDQTNYTPSIPSESKGKGPASSSNSSVMSHSQPQQTFSGPSHQYDSYKQQTGLPAGGLANTFAVNQATGMQYNTQNDGFVMPIETLNFPLSQVDDFDFSQNPSMDLNDMDFDLDSPSESLSTMMYPTSTSSQGQFVNPTTIGIKEESPAANPQVQRMYPGMHSAQAAQAAQAKAQAQQKQQEMIKQQRQRALAGQRQLPQQEPSRPQSSKPQQQGNDPAVEERISRLLQQMRQNSALTNEDDASTPTASGSQIQKMKKDEEDMDEDERLLASEEGKKLSSKERRQLRNKVSARAFRSRRKEYIGQLEGEVAAKAQEANDLRAQNRQLMEENTRLTDLTRMLLSSPAFSGFLTELSNNGLPAPQQPQQQQQHQAMSAQPQPTRKDINPHHAAQQLHNQPQIGMAMIPEQSIDFSMLDAPSSGYNSSFSVFAVTDLPIGPAVDTGIISGKSSNFVEPKSEQKDTPDVPSLPVRAMRPDFKQNVEFHEDLSVEFDAEEFPLFATTPNPTTNPTVDLTPIFGNIPAEKALAHIDLHVIEQSTDTDVIASSRLEQSCARLDASWERVEALITPAKGATLASSPRQLQLFTTSRFIPITKYRTNSKPRSLLFRPASTVRHVLADKPRVKKIYNDPETLERGSRRVSTEQTDRTSESKRARIARGSGSSESPYSAKHLDLSNLKQPTRHSQSTGHGLESEPKSPSSSQPNDALITKLWSKARSILSRVFQGPNDTNGRDDRQLIEGQPQKGQYQKGQQQKSQQQKGQHPAPKKADAAHKKRRQQPDKGFSDHPMRFYFKVITTPCADTPGTAILLHFDNKRYLFGQVSEGTQRACLERSESLLNVRHIFLTGQIGWQNVGGLLGLILTLADSHASRQLANPQLSKPTLHIAGGPNLQHFLASSRQFIFRKSLPLSVTELDGGSKDSSERPTWSDDNIQVWAINLKQHEEAQPDLSDTSKDSMGSGAASETEISRQRMRQDVVDQMFNSDWSLDKLDEVPLSQVSMPATIFVRNPETKSLELYTGPLPGTQENVPEINVFVRRPWPSSMTKSLPRARASTKAVAYIIKSQATRGKFLPAQAMKLGVPPGPLFAKLANRSSVQLTDGSWVHPEMVLDKTVPGSGLAIIDLTAGEFENDLCDRPEWDSPTIMQGVEAIIWLLKAVPSNLDQINTFAKRFPQIRHYYSSPSACPNSIVFQKSASSSVRLASQAPEHFMVPLHQDDAVHDLQRRNPDWSMSQSLSAVQQIPLERGLIIQIRPRFELQRQEVPPRFDLDELSRSIGNSPKVPATDATAKDVGEDGDESPLPGKDVEIITLGTGSALPSKYRNVSATLMRVPGRGSYLFDCGEGTLGQLKRMFPPDELQSVLLDLKMIWISHLHADHHLGLINVMKSYNSVRETSANSTRGGQTQPQDNPRLIIASDGDLFTMLDEYSSIGDLSLDRFLLLSCRSGKDDQRRWRMLFSEYVPGGLSRPFELEQHREATGGIKKLLICPVSHCRNAQAVSVCFLGGFKVSYSGDCRPSKRFISIGNHSTLLIHEATFDDEKAGDAVAKKHSTIKEALGVAVAMHAKRLVLTHFSQRYQKLPTMSDIKPTAIAFEDVSDSQEPPMRPLDEPGRLQVNPAAEGGSSNAEEAENELSPNNVQERTGTPSVSKPNDPRQPSGDIAIPDAPMIGSSVSNPFPSQFFPEEASSINLNVLPEDESSSERSAVEESPGRDREYETEPSVSKLHEMRVVFAFDLMKIRLRDFAKMERLAGAFQDLFKSGGQSADSTDQSKPEGQQSNLPANPPKSHDKDESCGEYPSSEQLDPGRENKRRKLNCEGDSTASDLQQQLKRSSNSEGEKRHNTEQRSLGAGQAKRVACEVREVQSRSKARSILSGMEVAADNHGQTNTVDVAHPILHTPSPNAADAHTEMLILAKNSLEQRLRDLMLLRGPGPSEARRKVRSKLERIRLAMERGVAFRDVPKRKLTRADGIRIRLSELRSLNLGKDSPIRRQVERQAERQAEKVVLDLKSYHGNTEVNGLRGNFQKNSDR